MTDSEVMSSLDRTPEQYQDIIDRLCAEIEREKKQKDKLYEENKLLKALLKEVL